MSQNENQEIHQQQEAVRKSNDALDQGEATEIAQKAQADGKEFTGSQEVNPTPKLTPQEAHTSLPGGGNEAILDAVTRLDRLNENEPTKVTRHDDPDHKHNDAKNSPAKKRAADSKENKEITAKLAQAKHVKQDVQKKAHPNPKITTETSDDDTKTVCICGHRVSEHMGNTGGCKGTAQQLPIGGTAQGCGCPRNKNQAEVVGKAHPGYHQA